MPWLIGLAAGWFGESAIMWGITLGIMLIILIYRVSVNINWQASTPIHHHEIMKET